jgi:glycosyltransferase involved in cell wall biosynthesis
MRICLLNDSFPPVIDGVANVVRNYAEYLTRDHGALVAVGTPRYPDADYGAYPYQVVPYQSFDTSALLSGYRTGNPFSAKYVSELAAFAPDIIHTHCPAASTMLARLLREQTGAPVIFTYHTKYDVDIERVLKVRLAAKEAIRTMVSAVEACDEVWVVSRGAGENLRSLGYTGDYRVVNNGVDFVKGKADDDAVKKATEGYDLPEGVPVYLFVGRMMKYKGLPIILDAMRKLEEAGRDYRCVFIGGGGDADEIRETAAGISKDKIIFTGPIHDREELRAWNTRADLFLFPSTYDTNGIVVREAAACGLASVLIKDSCASEGVTDGRNGYLIEENADAMAALLMKLGNDLAALHEVGTHAMDEIYISWADSVRTAHERYAELLEMKRTGALPSRPVTVTDIALGTSADFMELFGEAYMKSRAFREDMLDNFYGAKAELTTLQGDILQGLQAAWERLKNLL